MGDCVCNVEEPAEAFVVLTQSKHVLKAKCYWVCKFSCNSKPLFQLKIFIIQRKVDRSLRCRTVQMVTLPRAKQNGLKK